MRDEWPQELAQYPSATLLPQTTTEWDAVTGVPVTDADDADVISADEAWGLWKLGEDVGVGIVHVFALHNPHRDALCHAVEQALFGDLDPPAGPRAAAARDAVAAPVPRATVARRASPPLASRSRPAAARWTTMPRASGACGGVTSTSPGRPPLRRPPAPVRPAHRTTVRVGPAGEEI